MKTKQPKRRRKLIDVCGEQEARAPLPRAELAAPVGILHQVDDLSVQTAIDETRFDGDRPHARRLCFAIEPKELAFAHSLSCVFLPSLVAVLFIVVVDLFVGLLQRPRRVHHGDDCIAEAAVSRCKFARGTHSRPGGAAAR